jgi:hypothetical protein
MFPEQFAVGIITVSATGDGVADNRTMPAAKNYL